MANDTPPRKRWVLAGLAAGSMAAIPAALLSVPLKSPDDALLNSGSVAAGAIILGLAAGLIWRLLSQRARAWHAFTAVWLIAFAAVAAIAALGETQLGGTAGFVLPLAALSFILTGALTPLLARAPTWRWWVAPAALVVALAIGLPLSGRGDQESGHLSLPPAPEAETQATPTSAPAPTVTSTPPTPTPTAAATPSQSASAQQPTQAPAPASTPTTAAPTPQVRSVGQYDGVNFTIGQGSIATFTVREKLTELPLPNDAVVKNTAITGEVHLDGRPSVITLDLQKFSSDMSRRDSYIRRDMFRGVPSATITIHDPRHAPDGVQKGQVLTGQVKAILTLKGADYPLTFDLEGRDDGDVIYLLGKTRFTWEDVGMTPPNLSRIVQVMDEVSVEVLLAARPTTAAS